MIRTIKLYVTSSEGQAALNRTFRKAYRLYIPPPTLTLSQWSDEYAVISKEAAAFPGKFRTNFAEYQRGIMDAITDPNIETVVMQMCSQSGKSQIQMNAIGFYTHWEPSPMLFVHASLGEAEKFSKIRVAKMIRDTPVLREIYPSPRSRDSGNTLLNKEFLGGFLVMVGANAPAGLASMPIRVVFFDEVDRYEDSAGTEGDPVDLANKRTTTFWNRKKIMASTPGIKDSSRIEKSELASDQRRYFVPCPHCGEMQTMEWKRLRWKTESAGLHDQPRVVDYSYVCVNGCEILERAKHEMVRRGEWRATSQSHDGKTVGFHLNALYSPVVDWLDLIQEWIDAKGSLERRKTFINTRLAETWELKGTGADTHELEKRKENYREMLPEGVLFLTAGVDTQDDRLECSLIGWGMNDERWVIDHSVFHGDPSLPDTDSASPWAALRVYLMQDWPHALGMAMHPVCVLIDSGGHHTEPVYEFCRKHRARRWYACKGVAGINRALVNDGNRVGPFKTLLYSVGVDTAKEDLFTSFRVDKPGTSYCHFSSTLSGEYFLQVTSEKLVKTTRDFVTTMVWVKTRERNEALDCFVYARAAQSVLRPNFLMIRKNLIEQATEIERLRAAENPPAPPPPLPTPRGIALKTEDAPKPTPRPVPRPAVKPSSGASIANQIRNNFTRRR
jgi:phage terminase large subunit GpA-like protein